MIDVSSYGPKINVAVECFKWKLFGLNILNCGNTLALLMICLILCPVINSDVPMTTYIGPDYINVIPYNFQSI